jgi:hypothetical protein
MWVNHCGGIFVVNIREDWAWEIYRFRFSRRNHNHGLISPKPRGQIEKMCCGLLHSLYRDQRFVLRLIFSLGSVNRWLALPIILLFGCTQLVLLFLSVIQICIFYFVTSDQPWVTITSFLRVVYTCRHSNECFIVHFHAPTSQKLACTPAASTEMGLYVLACKKSTCAADRDPALEPAWINQRARVEWATHKVKDSMHAKLCCSDHTMRRTNGSGATDG